MITIEQLQNVAQQLASQSLNEAVISQLRKQYTNIHFTYCMDDDISSHQPILENEGFNLYLIDGREHCLCLTNDYENASGIVVAEIIPD